MNNLGADMQDSILGGVGRLLFLSARAWLPLLVTALVAGCASPDQYKSQSTMELCTNYLALPSYNVNQSTRAAELQRRGEDCSRYAAAAAVKSESDARFNRTLQSLSPPPRPPANEIRQGTHTYIVGGRAVTCTTMGTVTSCL